MKSNTPSAFDAYANPSSFADWLETQVPNEVQRIVAYRQALRTLRTIFYVQDDLFWLRHLRGMLVAGVALKCEQPAVTDLPSKVTGARIDLRQPIASNGSQVVRQAVRAALPSTDKRQLEVLAGLTVVDSFDVWRDLVREGSVDTQGSEAKTIANWKQLLVTNMNFDVMFAMQNGTVGLFEKQLWYGDVGDFSSNGFFDDGLARGLVQRFETDWKFWFDWYNRSWWGLPMDWQLLSRVARIADSVWERGHQAVGMEIANIEAIRQLEKGLIALEEERDFLIKKSRHGIGGNHPPEDMQIEPQIVRETTIIWAAVDELKVETEKEAPDKSAVLRIIETLGRALKAILAFAGRMGEHATKVAITATVSAATATIINNPKLVADVIEAAKAWVPFLP